MLCKYPALMGNHQQPFSGIGLSLPFQSVHLHMYEQNFYDHYNVLVATSSILLPIVSGHLAPFGLGVGREERLTIHL